MLTLLSSGQGNSSITVAELVSAFETRVAADSGVYEAKACQVTTLNTLTL